MSLAKPKQKVWGGERVELDTGPLAPLDSNAPETLRHNLGQTPEAFAGNALVLGALEDEGLGVLPLLILDGRIASKGHYPTRDELLPGLGLLNRRTAMLFLAGAPRHLFFTGKGGVGKTSLSSATAVALADRGRRVLLVTRKEQLYSLA